MKTLDETIAELEDEGLFADALHYLKEYRTTQIAYIKAMADLDDNPQLSWDELKQMEGKPVWVEYDDHLPGRKRTKFKVWEVISYVSDDLFIAYDDWSYHKDEMGDVWRAYRKERNDAQI